MAYRPAPGLLTCRDFVVHLQGLGDVRRVDCKVFAVDKTKSKKQQKREKKKLVNAPKKKANKVFWELCKPQYNTDMAAAKKTKGRPAKNAATKQVRKWYESHKNGLKRAQKTLGRCQR